MSTPRYFATDGIRGRVNQPPITPDIALRVGMAAGEVFRRGSHRHRVVIGKDTRLSCYMIENALTAGFSAMGMDVLLLGPIPTPAVAMLTRSMRADLGVMITASHNAFEDNGIKLFGPDGFKLRDSLEHEIESRITDARRWQLAEPANLGRVTRIEGVLARYVEYAKRTLLRQLDLSGMRIVIDCAHGAAYRVAPLALWELGADVVSIGVSPNGLNINKECGSTHLSALCNKVSEVRADIGIALDGDADRVVIVDETGRVVGGDQLLAVIAEYLHSQGRLCEQAVVGTVMSNLGLERYLATKSISFYRAAVGDRSVMEKMRAIGANLGGEPSGHVILSDYSTTGDGLLTALQILSVVREQDQPVGTLCHAFDPVPQEMSNVRVDKPTVLSHPSVQTAIRDWESQLGGDDGRLLVRPSGTEPVIRIMAECPNQERAREAVEAISETIRSAAAAG